MSLPQPRSQGLLYFQKWWAGEDEPPFSNRSGEGPGDKVCHYSVFDDTTNIQIFFTLFILTNSHLYNDVTIKVLLIYGIDYDAKVKGIIIPFISSKNCFSDMLTF